MLNYLFLYWLIIWAQNQVNILPPKRIGGGGGGGGEDVNLVLFCNAT